MPTEDAIHHAEVINFLSEGNKLDKEYLEKVKVSPLINFIDIFRTFSMQELRKPSLKSRTKH